MSDHVEIGRVFRKWYENKRKLEELQSKVEKYRNAVSQILEQSGKKELSVGSFKVTKRKNTRTYLTRESVPKEIWDKYSNRISYDALFITRLKESSRREK